MNIVYVGNVGVEGSSLAIHAQNVAKVLEKAGHTVSFVCKALQGKQQGFNNAKYYYATTRFQKGKLNTIEWIYEAFKGKKLLQIIRELNRVDSIDIIILYGYSGEKKLIKYCKKNKIGLVSDMVDWFEADDCEKGFPRLYNKYYVEKCRTKYHLELNGIIVISNYLRKYYDDRKQKTIFMPPVFEIPSQIKSISNNDVKHISYAGSLGGNKDIIKPVIEAVISINKNELKVILDLVGIEENEIKTKYGIECEGYGIHCYGRTTHEQATEIVSSSDFSVLLRNNKKYAKAGFSTKFVESMCVGVPVICTSIGGSDLYVENGKDGFLLPDNSVDTVKSIIQHIVEMNSDTMMGMKMCAFEKAKQLFNVNTYVDQINMFMNDIRLESLNNNV